MEIVKEGKSGAGNNTHKTKLCVANDNSSLYEGSKQRKRLMNSVKHNIIQLTPKGK